MPCTTVLNATNHATNAPAKPVSATFAARTWRALLRIWADMAARR